MTELNPRRPRYSPPRRLATGRPMTFWDMLRVGLSLWSGGELPLWRALLGLMFYAYTAPTTRSTNDVITASIWNVDLVDNITYLYGLLPSARVYHNTTQSMTLSTDNTVLFNSERWDNDIIHSTVSNTGRLTATTAGKYLITANIEWATAPATCELKLRVNGTTVVAWQQYAGSTKRCQISTIYDLAASDYVELLVNPATTQTINSTANYSPEYMMHRIGG